MAIVQDLTFADLNVEAIALPSIAAPIFTLSGTDILMNVTALTGDTFTALSETGFIEMMYKIRKLASLAQTTVNEATATTPEEELTAFPNFTFSLPSAEGLVEVTQVQSVVLSLDDSAIIGTN
jgi:coenzyme F420-reducing hydrogenase alpha subunit